MSPAWLGRMVAFDLETTGIDPLQDRIVTASCVTLGAAGVLLTRNWLVNPGIDIPAEATAIHGITTEHAKSYGAPPAEAVRQIREHIAIEWAAGVPLIVMNAAYDLTMLQAESARHGLGFLDIGPVIDPLVLDRHIDPYRKGKRNLEALAEHYGTKQDGAHTSEGDAVAAARVVWAMARRAKHILGKGSLEDLQRMQAEAQAEWARGYQDYLRKKDPAASVDGSWPCRAVAL